MLLLVDNAVQPYDWGLVDGIAAVLGTRPSGAPEAELWVGTHPRGPSVVAIGEHAGRTLGEVLAEDPGRWLGDATAVQGELSFLLKVLVIGSPLSLQAHPSTAQAREGFAREDAAGLDIDAPERTYRDASPKPEMLVALLDTWALCGFRAPVVADELLRSAHLPTLTGLAELVVQPDGLQRVLHRLLTLDPGRRAQLADELGRSLGRLAPTDLDDPWYWVAELAARYPGDPGCVAPLVLELVHLAPGESVHLPAGNLHAYLRGIGIEIMAASDNVLRGGLTPKHIDVDELLRILRFEPGTPPAPAVAIEGPVTRYDPGEAAFGLAVVDARSRAASLRIEAPSLLLPVGGRATVRHGGEEVEVGAGQAAYVAPGGEAYLSADAPVWWASTGAGLRVR